MTDGRHFGGYKYRNKRKTHFGRNSILGTVITAIAGSVISDLTSEESKIKKLFSKVVGSKQIENKENRKTIISTEYSVIDNENIKKEELTDEHDNK